MDRKYAKPLTLRRARLSLAISLASAGLLSTFMVQPALADYTGSLTDNGLVPGSLPVEGSENVLFWDGGGIPGDGTIQGGSGTWKDLTGNWTKQDGTSNSNWNGKFAVFQGLAGTITVDGTQSITGLQFVTDGYTLGGGGALQLADTGTTSVRVDQGATATLDVALTGNGVLNKMGAGTLVLNGNNTYSGGTLLNGGTLVLSGVPPFIRSPAPGSGALTAADNTTLASLAPIKIDNDITTLGRLNLVSSTSMDLDGTVSGSGSLVKTGTGSLTLNGINSYSGGTVIEDGNLYLGNGRALGTGDVSFTGATMLYASAMTLDQNLDVSGSLNLSGDNDLTLAGMLRGDGWMSKGGRGSLTLEGENTFSGNLDIISGTLRTTGNASLGNASVGLHWSGNLILGGDMRVGHLFGLGNVEIGANTLTLKSGSFMGSISGSGKLNKVDTGDLVLFGNVGHSGTTVLSGGKMYVRGSLGSTTVQVDNGATLGGSGSLTGNVTVADGGSLELLAGSTLSVGSLVLGDTSNLNVHLGAASASLPVLLAVNGDLTLDGLLNVTNIGGFGQGVYRLLDYSGNLSDNGLALNILPDSIAVEDVSLQTAMNKQVNLVVGAPSNLLFWDGSQTAANGVVDGGSGVWGASSSNWTLADGARNKAWNNTFAVFHGTAGTVTVDGSQRIGGLQFVSDGYVLTGGELLITGSTNVRVDSGRSATLDTAIGGSGSLVKLDNGTLVLAGSNTYSGGTTLSGGGVIGNTSSLQGAIVNNALLTFEQNSDGSYTGNLTGNGRLVKNGSGQLLLTGNSGLHRYHHGGCRQPDQQWLAGQRQCGCWRRCQPGW